MRWILIFSDNGSNEDRNRYNRPESTCELTVTIRYIGIRTDQTFQCIFRMQLNGVAFPAFPDTPLRVGPRVGLKTEQLVYKTKDKIILVPLTPTLRGGPLLRILNRIGPVFVHCSIFVFLHKSTLSVTHSLTCKFLSKPSLARLLLWMLNPLIPLTMSNKRFKIKKAFLPISND